MAIVEHLALQFAAVREDPCIEERVLREGAHRRVLLVGSAGCTALYLHAVMPELEIELVDPNPAQLAHVALKQRALGSFAPARFNVGTADPQGLHECGNFERLFRLFRDALDRFVISADERRRRFEDEGSDWQDVVEHRYWSAAFSTVFSDELLVAMFGPDAVQHARPHSYPSYFRQRIELGLRDPERNRNPWLHHVLLGHYREADGAWPPYLQKRVAILQPFVTHGCALLEVDSFAPYDFVQLSNVMDWMAPDDCAALATRLSAELAPGARILWRQLNNNRDLTGHFAPAFAFDTERDASLTADERSLFYNRVHCGVRA
jgi:S-adenosylmethionine-diacylglycerol 3-amino-3-carboxypropyl transferase